MAGEMELDVISRSNVGSLHQSFVKYHQETNQDMLKSHLTEAIKLQNVSDRQNCWTQFANNCRPLKRKLDTFTEEMSTNKREVVRFNDCFEKINHRENKRRCTECNVDVQKLNSFSNGSQEAKIGNETLVRPMEVCKDSTRRCQRCEAGEGGHLGHILS